jgi:hypothetical protein
MSDVDARLAAALGADAPPERDALFRLGVLARTERARFRRRILWTSAIGLVAALLVVVNASRIDAWIAADPWHGWIVGAAALAAMLALPGMPTAATPGVRTVVKVLGHWFSG